MQIYNSVLFLKHTLKLHGIISQDAFLFPNMAMLYSRLARLHTNSIFNYASCNSTAVTSREAENANYEGVEDEDRQIIKQAMRSSCSYKSIPPLSEMSKHNGKADKLISNTIKELLTNDVRVLFTGYYQRILLTCRNSY